MDKTLEKNDEKVIEETVAKAKEAKVEEVKEIVEEKKEDVVIEEKKEEVVEEVKVEAPVEAPIEKPTEEKPSTVIVDEVKQEKAEDATSIIKFDTKELTAFTDRFESIVKSFVESVNKMADMNKVETVTLEKADEKKDVAEEVAKAVEKEMASVKQEIEKMGAQPEKSKVVMYERDYVAKSESKEDKMADIQKELDKLLEIKNTDPARYEREAMFKKACDLVDLKKTLLKV